MTKLIFYWRKARTTPFKELIRLVGIKFANILKDFKIRIQDKFFSSYFSQDKIANSTKINTIFIYVPPVPENKESILKHLCDYYIDHRFDLLGSGWVKVFYGMRCRGLEGHCYNSSSPPLPDDEFVNTPNYKEIKRIRNLIHADYKPIDWHIDFKSGYRWIPTKWYSDIIYGHLPGVDIKVPWELSRLQHLPQLALAYDCSTRGCDGFLDPEIYSYEFRNQVLDFIASNPPRFGVNWACTMDVAIRAANLVVAYDLFKTLGASFDQDFDAVFIRSLFEHGHHISRNLEWSKELRANHYLANISGLAFVSKFLPSSAETDTWLAFAIQELIAEVDSQFYADGANFEASTVYHRLSAEMVVYSTALILGSLEDTLSRIKHHDPSIWNARPPLKAGSIMHYMVPVVNEDANVCLSPFPSWYFERVERMAEFSMHTTKPSGHVVQIGDNDSGRFFKFSLSYGISTVRDTIRRYRNLKGYDDLPEDAPYIDEEHLDHRHIVAAINGFFGRDDFKNFYTKCFFDFGLIVAITGNLKLKSYHLQNESGGSNSAIINLSISNFLALKAPHLSSKKYEYHFEGISLLNDCEWYCYPYFGLYIFRGERIFLSVRAGTVGQNGFGGHAHNDQLSIELQVDGKDIISDPGTYLYTPFSKTRNNYRSIHAHFAPAVDAQESVTLNDGLFRLRNSIYGECIGIGNSEIICRTNGGLFSIFRYIKVNQNSVKIVDYYPSGHSVTCQSFPVDISSGYGKVFT
jgi:hypothetical protein